MVKHTTQNQAENNLSNLQLSGVVARAFCQPLQVLGYTESSLSAFSVFWCVAFEAGRIQVEVADLTGLSAKTVSRVLSQLGETRSGRGWISQRTDDNDRRVRRLHFTRKGRAVHGRMLRDLRKYQAKIDLH